MRENGVDYEEGKVAIEREQNHACMNSAEREQARPKGKVVCTGSTMTWLEESEDEEEEELDDI